MIEILQETKTSVVCVKPVGIAAQGTDPQALPQLLAAQLGCEVYPVHRLDQTVGGVMVYAKTAKEAARLTQSMGEGGMQKTYLAVLTGCPEKTSGTLEDLLFHDRVKNKTYVVRRPRGGVKKAVLSYEILAEAEGLSLARLPAARRRQIRQPRQPLHLRPLVLPSHPPDWLPPPDLRSPPAPPIPLDPILSARDAVKEKAPLCKGSCHRRCLRDCCCKSAAAGGLRRPYLFSRKRKDMEEKSAWTRLVLPASEFRQGPSF